MIRALTRRQRLAMTERLESATSDIRRLIAIEPACGPILVEAYHCLSALARLREAIDALPVVMREEPRT
jgi:hypothetical protein